MRHSVALDDGDVVIIHDDCPQGWRPGDQVALLNHGLIGSHQSPLLVRLTAKLTARGLRVFRWDMRGCGAGEGLARFPYHAGCSHDLSQVIAAVVGICSPIGSNHRSFLNLVGVSLSGNILLKYLGEHPERVPHEVRRAVAVNPPIDLSSSLTVMKRSLAGWYDRHFASKLFDGLVQRRRQCPTAPMPAVWQRPKGLKEFDDWYTAPISGYGTADNYYRTCSAAQFLSNIRIPTSIITSCDDPIVPVSIFQETSRWSSQIQLAITSGGGHVGYFARKGLDPDEFWLDWRIIDLMTA